MNILVDMNLSPTWCPVLEQGGHRCVHWSDVGDPRASDESIMKWALEDGFVVFTHDLDFGAILAATRARAPSVVQLRTQDVMPSAVGRLLLRVLREHQEKLVAGALVVVDEANSRVRVLPLSAE